jgi:nitroreductase
MDLFEAIASRRSVRQFRTDAAVSDEAVQTIIEAGTLAPSAGNEQSWRFIVVRDVDLKRRLATEAGHQAFIQQAPVAIVVAADMRRAGEKYGERGRLTYAIQETAAAIENMLLAICALGLGSCWVGAFDETKAAQILDLPSNLRPVAILPVGVAVEPKGAAPARRRMADVCEFR